MGVGLKAVGMSASRNASRPAGILPFRVWGRKGSGCCLQGLTLVWRGVFLQWAGAGRCCASCASCALAVLLGFQGGSEPGPAAPTPAEPMLEGSSEPAENLTLTGSSCVVAINPFPLGNEVRHRALGFQTMSG